MVDEVDFYSSLDRFSAFSDGVFAIAITLLVLNLPVPPESAVVLASLFDSWQDFLGYVISFAFIGGIWLTHSGLTRLMKRGNSVSYGLNLLLLLFVAVLPFSTQLMVTHLGAPDVEVAVMLYGANVLLASLSLSLLIYYVSREPSLAADNLADERLKRLYRQRWLSVGVNVLALAVALVAPLVAVTLYLIATALVLGLPLVGALRSRRSRTTRAGG